ncbi:MAG: hypothetical protein PHU31_05460 [Anaerotignum sp.]|nr:hypothetical protein [Anaerotignum sp.]
MRSFDNLTPRIPCPNCKYEIPVSLNQLVTTLVCPCCNSEIHLEHDDYLDKRNLAEQIRIDRRSQ